MKITGIIFLLIGFTFLLIQNIFYGYVDLNGILHDSIFLPLGVLFALVGVLFLIIFGIRTLIRKAK